MNGHHQSWVMTERVPCEVQVVEIRFLQNTYVTLHDEMHSVNFVKP